MSEWRLDSEFDARHWIVAWENGGIALTDRINLGRRGWFLEMWHLATFLCELNCQREKSGIRKRGFENATGEVFADHNLHHRILIIQHS